MAVVQYARKFKCDYDGTVAEVGASEIPEGWTSLEIHQTYGPQTYDRYDLCRVCSSLPYALLLERFVRRPEPSSEDSHSSDVHSQDQTTE